MEVGWGLRCPGPKKLLDHSDVCHQRLVSLVHFGSKLPILISVLPEVVFGWFSLEGGLAFGAEGLGLGWFGHEWPR